MGNTVRKQRRYSSVRLTIRVETLYIRTKHESQKSNDENSSQACPPRFVALPKCCSPEQCSLGTEETKGFRPSRLDGTRRRASKRKRASTAAFRRDFCGRRVTRNGIHFAISCEHDLRRVEGVAEVEDDAGGGGTARRRISRSRRNTMARIVAAASYALRLW